VIKEVIGRTNEHLRKQSVFREAIITSLLESLPRRTTSLNVIVSRDSPLRLLEEEAILARHYILTGGLRRRECYFCRYKVVKGVKLAVDLKKTYRGCLVYKLPFCVRCFKEYHYI